MTLSANIDRDQVEANVAKGYGDNGAVFVLDSFMLYVDDRDQSVAEHLIRDGYWESWITSWMTRNVGPDMFCIDIGANFGYYTGVLNELAEDVVAFEPNPDLYEMLKKSSRVNSWDEWVTIHNVALGAETGTGTLIMNDYLMGSGSVLFGEEYFKTFGDSLLKYAVKIERLDDYGYRPDFVKIDAEGFEPQIFEGGEETLASAEIILVEATKDHPAEFLDMLFERWDVRFVETDGSEWFITREQVNTMDWVMLVLRRK